MGFTQTPGYCRKWAGSRGPTRRSARTLLLRHVGNRWHLPVVEHDVEVNSLADYKFFAASGHALDPDFDFMGMYVFYGTPQSYDGERLSRPALIEELFGDQMEEYIAGERRRWELTEKHWDTRFLQMDPHQEPFSVFYPIFTDCN